MNRLLFRDFGTFLRARRADTDLCAIPVSGSRYLFARHGATVTLPTRESRVLLTLMAALGPVSRAELMAGEEEAARAAVAYTPHPAEIDCCIEAIQQSCEPLRLWLPSAHRQGWALLSAMSNAHPLPAEVE